MLNIGQEREDLALNERVVHALDGPQGDPEEIVHLLGSLQGTRAMRGHRRRPREVFPVAVLGESVQYAQETGERRLGVTAPETLKAAAEIFVSRHRPPPGWGIR